MKFVYCNCSIVYYSRISGANGGRQEIRTPPLKKYPVCATQWSDYTTQKSQDKLHRLYITAMGAPKKFIRKGHNNIKN